MDPVTILTVAGMAFTAAEKAFEAGVALGNFINDVKYVDQTIGLLVTEVNSLSAACELVGNRIKGIAEAMDAGKEKDSKKESSLWIQVRTQLEDCSETVTALYEAVKDVGLEKKKNPFAQAWRQIQLNMKAKDIEEARNRIRSHTASLQLVLQAITLELSYLAPHRADQQLLVLLENIRDIKQELSLMRHNTQEQGVSDTELRHDEKEAELIKYTDQIISSGETLYEGSISGSVIGDTTGLGDKITSWVSRLQVLSTDTATTDLDDYHGSSISGADTATLTDNTDMSDDEEDDLEIEMIKEAYELGTSEFQSQDYDKANMLLQEVLSMVEESAIRSRTIDIRELRWMLAVCAYHTDDFPAAEAALKEIVQVPPQGQEDRVRLCEAGHILALASLKQGKLAEARQYCDSALQGRRRLLGKQDPACYESLALLARIFELQDNSARAVLYARMIPEEQRDAVCKPYQAIGSQASLQAMVGEKKSEVNDKELPPLPPGPPPYAPAESESPTQSTSSLPDLPPERRWKFRPPIPSAPAPPPPPPAAIEIPDRPPIPGVESLSEEDSFGDSMADQTNNVALPLGRTATLPVATTSRPEVPRTQSAATPTTYQREVERRVDIAAYRDEVKRTQKRHGKKSLPTQNALQRYATAVHGMDLKQADANAAHEELSKSLRDNLDDGHPLVYKTYANLAKIAENNGDFNKSSDYYQKVLDGMKKNPADDSVFKTNVQSQLADTYINMEKPDKAYSVLREELKARRKVYGSRLKSAETADVAKRLREVRLAMQASGRKHKHRKDGDDGASVMSSSSGDTRTAGRR